MKTGGDFRDHLVDLTDGSGRPGETASEKQAQRRVRERFNRDLFVICDAFNVESLCGSFLVASLTFLCYVMSLFSLLAC